MKPGTTLRELEQNLLDTNPLVREGYDNPTAAEKMGMLLRQLRNASGLSQQQLAKVSGVQQADISRHEKGKAPRGLTLSQLEKIAHAQGVEIVIGFVEKATVVKVAADTQGKSTAKAAQSPPEPAPGELSLDGLKFLMHAKL